MNHFKSFQMMYVIGGFLFSGQPLLIKTNRGLKQNIYVQHCWPKARVVVLVLERKVFNTKAF